MKLKKKVKKEILIEKVDYFNGRYKVKFPFLHIPIDMNEFAFLKMMADPKVRILAN